MSEKGSGWNYFHDNELSYPRWSSGWNTPPLKRVKKTQRDGGTIQMMSWHQQRRLRCHLNKWVRAGPTGGDANKSKVGKSKRGAGAHCSSRQIISFCLTFSGDARGMKTGGGLMWKHCRAARSSTQRQEALFFVPSCNKVVWLISALQSKATGQVFFLGSFSWSHSIWGPTFQVKLHETY